jgi:hypothetical protein
MIEEHEQNAPADKPDTQDAIENEAPCSPPKRGRWLRRVLLSLLIFFIVLLALPWLIYLPPIQSWLKDIACDQIYDATGMRASIDLFRLRFPLDVELDGVTVLDVSGDTMVNARQAIVDVQVRPLLNLDVKVNKLHLIEGYYRMVSKDSSMILTMRAADLETNSRCSADISTGVISLDKVKLSGGDVKVYMDVWKQVPTPPEPGKFIIKVRDAEMTDFRFAMSMLPTIDTLTVTSATMHVRDANVNLVDNKISIGSATLRDGDAKYIVPTAKYIASHPAPAPSPYESIPMVVTGDTLKLENFTATYATKGAKAAKGFDPSYISMAGLNIHLNNFYNRASEVELPITLLSGKERCGIQITEGSGYVKVDTTGIILDKLAVKTLFSSISADAYLSYPMMAMDTSGAFDLDANASVGLPDINSFMPAIASFTKLIPRSRPINAKVTASGSLADLRISKCDLSISQLLTLNAAGRVVNAMEPKKLKGELTFAGNVINAEAVKSIAGMKSIPLPPFSIKGKATAERQNYAAQFALLSPQGNVSAEGRVGLNSESYHAEVDIHGLNMRYFMPDMGIGVVDGTLYADGAGFNPAKHGARTTIYANINSIDYQNRLLEDIDTSVTLADGAFDAHLLSQNLLLDGDIYASGTIAPDNYFIDLRATLNHADLHELGITKDICNGSGVLTLRANAAPDKWLYDVDMNVSQVDWQLPDSYLNLPRGIDLCFHAGTDSVTTTVNAANIDLDFAAQSTLKQLMEQCRNSASLLADQIKARSLDVELLQTTLPQFRLNVDARSDGHIRDFLEANGINANHFNINLENGEKIQGNAIVSEFNTGTMLLDTLTLSLDQNSSLLNYKLHMGNTAGNLDEFHQVNVNGYVGGQRASLFLRQQNLQGETGYRLGLTAAVTDSLMTLHFTPLKATIAYMPWVFNDDNYIEYDFDKSINADLSAYSSESKVEVHTRQDEGKEAPTLLVDIENLKIQDFLKMSLFGPPISGAVNANLELGYEGSAITGCGSLGVNDLYYDKIRVGNLDTHLDAGVDFNGNTSGDLSLMVEGKEALTLHGILRPDSVGILPGDIGVTLKRFPLSIANPFLGKDVAQLSGSVSGEMGMTGSFSKPILNGGVRCDSVNVYLPIMGGKLWLDPDTLLVKNNVIKFEDYNIRGANSNPLLINGTVDATDLTSPLIDLKMRGDEFMLINNDKRAKSDLYGKLLLNINATAKGSMSLLNINANASVLSGSDVYYTLSYADQLTEQNAADVVKFVQFSDTTRVVKPDTVVNNSSRMKIAARLDISNGVQTTINLSNNGTDKVQVSPYGQLTYNQSYMGDSKLNGQITLGSGFARYNIPVIGDKKFEIDPSSYLLWNGTMMNPTLNISAEESLKSAVQSSSGGSHLVSFLISVAVTGSLESPNILFDLDAENDISIQNELKSMSADQRSNQAMNMLLYGKYTGPGSSSSSTNDLLTNPLYSFLESKINSWAANNIRGVDLSFGIDRYSASTSGSTGTTTSYSYQVSKSLFDNRFKIVVGGNYSTDANVDENFSQNLISDISFEYMLRQTNNLSMYLKLFRHNDYENILEGEVSEMGVGYVMQRKMKRVSQLFSWLRPKRKRKSATLTTDSVTTAPSDTTETPLVIVTNDN